jgi:hypothetical protein
MLFNVQKLLTEPTGSGLIAVVMASTTPDHRLQVYSGRYSGPDYGPQHGPVIEYAAKIVHWAALLGIREARIIVGGLTISVRSCRVGDHVEYVGIVFPSGHRVTKSIGPKINTCWGLKRNARPESHDDGSAAEPKQDAEVPA